MVKTSSGYECTPNEKIGNDWRFIEALEDCDSDSTVKQITGIKKMLHLMLSEEDIKALYDHVREEDGTIPTDKIMKEVTEVFEEMRKELKN